MIKHQKNSERTQRKNTVGSYEKAIGAIIAGHKNEVTSILDYAAGHGLGTEMLLELDYEAKSYEPMPINWASSKPVDYTQSDQVSGDFDAVICLNTLNVLERDIRDEVLRHIYSVLSPGGAAVLGVRSIADVMTAKNMEAGPEIGSAWINDVYQKGFTQKEMSKWILEILPDATVTKCNVCKVGVLVVKP